VFFGNMVILGNSLWVEFLFFFLQSHHRNIWNWNIPTHKLKSLIAFISSIKMEWFKASHVDINLENQFQIFIFFKSDFSKSFWSCLGYPPSNENYISYHNFLTIWKLLGRKDIPCPHVVWKFQRKRIETEFVVSYPKLLCCQKTQLGLLWINP